MGFYMFYMSGEKFFMLCITVIILGSLHYCSDDANVSKLSVGECREHRTVGCSEAQGKYNAEKIRECNATPTSAGSCKSQFSQLGCRSNLVMVVCRTETGYVRYNGGDTTAVTVDQMPAELAPRTQGSNWD
jgi:hypothetical protein